MYRIEFWFDQIVVTAPDGARTEYRRNGYRDVPAAFKEWYAAAKAEGAQTLEYAVD